MRKHQKKILLSICLLLTITLTGCNSFSHSTQKDVVEDTQETVYPLKIKDQADRTIELKEEPQSIVSGYYISSSMLISLGVKERITGIETAAKKRPIYQLSAPKLLALPEVGTAKRFNVEVCASIHPDLVVLPLKLKDVVPTLEELNIPVLLVNPENDTLSDEALDMLATATNTQQQYKKISNYTKDVKEEISKSIKDVKKQSVYFAGNSNVLSTAGHNMYQNTMIETAGANNVAKDIEDVYWANVSYEQIIAWNPAVIIVAPMANYSIEDIKNDANLKEVAAIKNNKVYQMPCSIEAWDSPIPASILGSTSIASFLYPEAYSTDKFDKTVSDFYQKFYNFNVNDIK